MAEVDPAASERRAQLRSQLPPDVELSQKQVTRLLQRLRMFNRLRAYVIPRGRDVIKEYFESGKKQKDTKGLPSWWKIDHDVELMFAVEKHGFMWEDMIKDTSFSFTQIWRDMGGSEEKEKAEIEQKQAERKARRSAPKSGDGAAAKDGGSAAGAAVEDGEQEGGGEEEG